MIIHKLASFSIIVLCSVFILSNKAAATQLSSQVPTDLAFMSQQQNQYRVMLLEHETNQLRKLYAPEGILNLRPISWSNDGNRLAILQMSQNADTPDDIIAQFCILNIQGEVQTCFDDKPYVPPAGL